MLPINNTPNCSESYGLSDAPAASGGDDMRPNETYDSWSPTYYALMKAHPKKESPWDVELHLAAARGDAKRLLILLDSGRVHVDCKDKDGTTPLILAAAGGHIESVTELLQQGANPNAKRLTGTTGLFFAAQGGYADIVAVLVEEGAVVDSCSIDGGTPLFVACQCGHLDVVEALIERGANVNAQMKDGATALFIAAQNGHERILEILLEQGAKTDAARTDGATALWIAAQMGHDHIVRRLLKAGAKVDATRHDGATALFKAAHKGHTAVIGELLKYRPSLGILPNGESALHAAALTGHMTVARQLVGAGADPLLVNLEGLTPLQLATRHSQTQVASYLKDKVRARSTTSR